MHLTCTAIFVRCKLKTLGVPLDAARAFEESVNNVAKACNFYMWGLCHIRRSISRDVANIMAASIVDTRLDYCNALLQDATDKLQIVQNKRARVICNVTTRQQHTIDLLRNLYWLPIGSRIRSSLHLVLQSIPAPSKKLSARHIGAIPPMPWTEICWDGLGDSTRVAYQNRGTPFRQQYGTADLHCPSVSLTAS